MTAIPRILPSPGWRIARHTLCGRRSIVLSVQGRMAAGAMDALRAPLDMLLQDDAGQVVLDLADAHWLDGSGVAAIGYLFKRLSAAGRRLTVAGAGGQPREMLASLGLAEMLAPLHGQPLPMADRFCLDAPAGPRPPRVALRLVRAR